MEQSWHHFPPVPGQEVRSGADRFIPHGRLPDATETPDFPQRRLRREAAEGRLHRLEEGVYNKPETTQQPRLSELRALTCTNPALRSQHARHTQYPGEGGGARERLREMPHILKHHKLLPIVSQT